MKLRRGRRLLQSWPHRTAPPSPQSLLSNDETVFSDATSGVVNGNCDLLQQTVCPQQFGQDTSEVKNCGPQNHNKPAFIRSTADQCLQTL